MLLSRTTNKAEVQAARRDLFSLEQTIAAENLRQGAGWFAQGAMLGVLLLLGAALMVCSGDFFGWITHRLFLLLTLAGIGCWRWSWFVIQNCRAILYRYIVYPRLRADAQRSAASRGPVPEVVVMATTYHERTWITEVVFAAILRELATLQGAARRPRVVVATGCAEDEATIRAVFAQHDRFSSQLPPEQWPPELVLVREENGKRSAIGAALREIAKSGLDPEGAVVFIDGDTVLQPGFLQKVLPLFRASPAVDALTTNEEGYVKGPAWFGEWIALRFGLRHRTMCSVALSGKLLCLTGRLSVFRGSVALDPGFLAQIEHDVIKHWLWGKFEMLSGDDKSTWFWLSRHGCRMLYVPDAKVTTIEVVPALGLVRGLANIRRWSGNSLRHNWRALRLGPKKLGWFPWWSIVDQRFTMFTVLLGPVICLAAVVNGRLTMASGFCLWLLISRLGSSAIAWRHGGRWSAFYLPLILASDWATALAKIWILFHPAKQSWLNRGARTLDSTRQSKQYALQAAMAHYLYVFTCALAVVSVWVAAGFFPAMRELRLFINVCGDDVPIARSEEVRGSSVPPNPGFASIPNALSGLGSAARPTPGSSQLEATALPNNPR
ncbi:MAG TPA: glycosyltransferase [Patescibacteria group bacterium]|nr:glycosyltransferase [Patescibacteria group bacterium]